MNQTPIYFFLRILSNAARDLVVYFLFMTLHQFLKGRAISATEAVNKGLLILI